MRLARTIVAVTAATIVASGCRGPTHPSATVAVRAAPQTVPAPTVPATTVPAPVRLPPLAPGSTFTVSPQGSIPGSPSPGALPDRVVPAAWYGVPSVLPVIAEQPGWLQVRLAQRPNETTTWVPIGDVAVTSTPYRIVVSLTSEHLVLYDSDQPVLDVPIGIGTPRTPTVTGHFFIAMKVAPPSPGYGPFVLGTSAHSDTITDWGGSGDAVVAIHGPIDAAADARIGTTGAAVSNGCIRLHIRDLVQLDAVPPGTPLDITA